MWTIASPTSVLVSFSCREHEEDRRQQRLVGNDQGEEQEDEEELLAGDREARQRDSRPGMVRSRQNAIVRNGDPAAVEEIGRQALLIAPEPLVAVEAELVGEIGRRYRRRLLRRLQRRRHREDERRQHDRADRQADGAEQVSGAAAPDDASNERSAMPPESAARLGAQCRYRRGAHAWLRRVSTICTTVQASTITARMSESAAP